MIQYILFVDISLGSAFTCIKTVKCDAYSKVTSHDERYLLDPTSFLVFK